MRLFVYEYTAACTSGAGSLGQEGWAMLSAVVEDFGRIPGIHTSTLVHAGVERTIADQCMAASPDREESTLKELARSADYTLVIAPEFDGLLETRCRWVVAAGGRLLGPRPDAVALTADKLALAEHLKKHSVSTPATVLRSERMAENPWPFPVVYKPRYGAGSQHTFLLRSWPPPSPTDHGLRTTDSSNFILQPFIPGQSASVAFLIGRNGVQPLMPATQEFSQDGRFHYLGGRLPLAVELADRAVRLGRRALETVPGLRGYVGVDLILGKEPDGSTDSVIEINPRLTTSYIGLRRLARQNLAAAMLETVITGKTPNLEWAPDSVTFRGDGSYQLSAVSDQQASLLKADR